ncbi:GTP pyrophosphokinase family protein [Yoonia sp. SDW83-1]|uniref:GTP pyrophosphokinase n=1 Tax=Yoonia sp. SDW83-1 TaxID=3366945 RepID=UPI00398C5AB2
MSKEADFKLEFTKRHPQYVRLESCITSILGGAISELDVDSFPVSHRIKTIESALGKIASKSYENAFEEITDFVAFRIIVYLESDVEKVADCVRQLFTIDENNSIDKRMAKNTNEFGYRSLHLICQLGEQRADLQEYTGIAKQKFEVQIRTVLQHAWAEIEHKKNYKGVNSLPEVLERRLMAVSGTLELLDREFSDISLEAEKYARLVKSDAPSISEDKLTSLAVDSAFEGFVLKVLNRKVAATYASKDLKEGILAELNGFGINTPSELRKLLNNKFAKDLMLIDSRANDGSLVGYLRCLMMIEDVENYFLNGFPKHGFDTIAPLTLDLIEQVTSDNEIRAKILSHITEGGY